MKRDQIAIATFAFTGILLIYDVSRAIAEERTWSLVFPFMWLLAVVLYAVPFKSGLSDQDEQLLLKRIYADGVKADRLQLGTQAKHRAKYEQMGFTVTSAEIEQQVRDLLDTIQGFDDYFGPRKDER